MLTLKHVEPDGHEGIQTARELSFNESQKQLTAFGCPGPDEGARRDGVVNYGTGRVYVMNDNGKTVAVYDLYQGEPPQPAA
jgi:hypothetical protein